MIRKILFTFTYPKIVHIVTIYYLIWMSFDNAYTSHIDPSLFPDKHRHLDTGWCRGLVHLGAFMIILTQVVLEYIYEKAIIDFYILNFVYLGLNIAVPIFFIVLELMKSTIYSGLPYLNPAKHQRSQEIKRTILRYLLGKIIDAATCTFLMVHSFTSDEAFEEWMTGDGVKGLVLYMAIILMTAICEFYPIYYSIDPAFVEIMKTENEMTTPLLKDSRKSGVSASSQFMQSQGEGGDTSKRDPRKVFADTSLIRLVQLDLDMVGAELPS